ncbi:hypothetical protein LJC49_02465 [Ruminococcaceae bacterium OttesenSCG-928-I18]|nr:hypothetical protein [Ruminococcaceae bacterium OttesenSCG-928-I18]
MAMTIGSLAQESQINSLVQKTQENNILQSQLTSVKKNETGQAANTDRVEISKAMITTPSVNETPGETPPMFKLFSEEIESAIGRIENIIKDSRNAPATGSMMSYQKTEVVNNPGKGVMGNNRERLAEEMQRADQERQQEAAAQSITSPSRGSITATIERMGSEQASRGQQPQAIAAAQLAY